MSNRKTIIYLFTIILITSFLLLGSSLAVHSYRDFSSKHQTSAPYSSDYQGNSVYSFITSSFSGVNQILSVKPGQQGEMIYQNVNVSIFSTSLMNYTVYVNGNLQAKGNVSGFISYLFKESGSTVNIDAFVGNTSFQFNNEIVLHTPIQSLYSPKPPPLVASFRDLVFALLKGVIGLFPMFILGYISLKPVVVNIKNRTPVVW